MYQSIYVNQWRWLILVWLRFTPGKLKFFKFLSSSHPTATNDISLYSYVTQLPNGVVIVKPYGRGKA